MPTHSWRDPHIVRTFYSLLKALYITLGAFLVLFVLFRVGSALYVSSLVTKTSSAFHAGITKDLAYLKTQQDTILNNDQLKTYLLANDSKKLIDLLIAEKNQRSIGLMSVTDSEGIVMGRTRAVGKRGDNTFLTTPYGRTVSHDGSVQSIEVSGVDPTQLIMITGEKVVQNDHMIGALFTGNLLDDAYAIRFRNAYLPRSTQIIFYTKEYGVYGNSFENQEVHKLVNSYFNSGSEWIKNSASEKTIEVKNNEYYIIENSIFPGSEDSPGGALLFIPRNDITPVANIVTTLITLMVFAFLAFRYHGRLRPEERGWRCYVLFIGATLIFAVVFYFALRIQNIGFLKLERTPYALYNSVLRLQPDYGIYDTGFERRISIIADTGDEAINAVQIGLIYDPKAIKLESLDTASSTCSYVIENAINQESGKAHLSCVIVEQKDGQNSFPIADVVLTPLRTGTFTLSFDDEETKVLANDGLGTNVLRASQSGSYRVEDFSSMDVYNASATTHTLQPLVIFSPTHPNQSRWYNTRTARFVWQGKNNQVYTYAFDNTLETIPLKTRTVQGPSIALPIPGDGIFYFHLQAVSGGPIAHYRVQSDLTPPSLVSMQLSADNIIAGDVVRFTFNAEDAGSGIQRNYYVDLGNHLFLPIGSQLFIPFLETGAQKIVLRVYDSAGNYAEKSQVITVVAR